MAVEKFTGTFTKEESGCTILINETIQLITEEDVLGVYVYLLTKPTGWNINAQQLMNHFNRSKDKIYRILNRLIDLRLLTRKEIRDEGKFQKFHYTLHLRPLPENQDMDKNALNQECVDLPCPDLPYPEIQDAYKTKIYTKQRLLKKEKYIQKEKKEISNSQVEEFIEIWNTICTPIGCPRMGHNKKQIESLKRSIKNIRDNWEEPFNTDNFKTLLEAGIDSGFYLLNKFHTRMDVFMRWEHFDQAYQHVKKFIAGMDK